MYSLISKLKKNAMAPKRLEPLTYCFPVEDFTPRPRWRQFRAKLYTMSLIIGDGVTLAVT